MIAIIAGTGSLPIEACRALLAQGKQFFVITLFPENNLDALRCAADDAVEIVAQECYKLGDIMSLLKTHATTHVLWIGKVDKSHMFKHFKFDWLAIKLLGSLWRSKSDRDIMETLVAELARNNIQVLRQDTVLGGLLVKPGVLTGALTPALENDIRVGLQAAQAIAHANIGQTVVVKDGMVLAVEAIEGTDACIARGLALGTSGLVICKAARTDQNKTYDLPTLGPRSLENFKPGDVHAIAWVSDCTLIADKDTFVHRAQELGITLVSVAP